jgi:hypothetical protein
MRLGILAQHSHIMTRSRNVAFIHGHFTEFGHNKSHKNKSYFPTTSVILSDILILQIPDIAEIPDIEEIPEIT